MDSLCKPQQKLISEGLINSKNNCYEEYEREISFHEGTHRQAVGQ